jgi:hypothetical protein
MPDLRSEWTCDGCGMRCYRMTGEPFPRPEGWAGDRCVSCTREVEEPEVRARRLLLDGAIVNRVYKLCRPMSMREVSAVRNGLIESGELSPDAPTAPKEPKPDRKPKPPKPRPQPPKAPDPKRVEAERLMREDPRTSNKEIGDSIEANRRVVGAWRRKLGLPTSESARRAEATALITADPTLRNAEVKARMRHPVSAPIIRQIRSELGIAPPALN